MLKEAFIFSYLTGLRWLDIQKLNYYREIRIIAIYAKIVDDKEIITELKIQ